MKEAVGLEHPPPTPPTHTQGDNVTSREPGIHHPLGLKEATRVSGGRANASLSLASALSVGVSLTDARVCAMLNCASSVWCTEFRSTGGLSLGL